MNIIPLVVHAAVNAIISKTRESVEGCTLYVTQYPDKDCTDAILLAKIEVVCRETNDPNKLATAKKALGDKLK